MRANRPTRTARSPRDLTLLALVLGALLAAVIASAAAQAAGATRVLGAASSPALRETIVVDSHGRTLYALRPETTRHLLCRSRACLEVWLPLTVRSASVRVTAGHGVEGRLGLLHRSGKWQVTLRGMPLYRFSGDSAKGEANGEGIRSFGGVWHAVRAGKKPAAPPTTPPTPSTPTMTPLPY
jgi:predicted lipoprotein with Yx(FWY)xxD motif